MRRCSRCRWIIFIRSIPISETTRDLPSVLIEQIAHFFEHYKELEQGKWVKVLRWLDVGEAQRLVQMQ